MKSCLRVITLENGNVVTSKGDYSVTVSKEDYRKWTEGMLIQFAMPSLNSEQREFLISGTTPAEWNAMFPEEP